MTDGLGSVGLVRAMTLHSIDGTGKIRLSLLCVEGCRVTQTSGIDLLAGARYALVIATDVYDRDATLARLRSPVRDAKELAEVLGRRDIGRFDVQFALDRTADELLRTVDNFLTQREPDDLVLVYLSCHGVRDSHGRLHFAARDTDTMRLASTSIDSRWLMEQLEECRARRQVILLDCCFSGAFAGLVRGDSAANLVESDIREHLVGHGRGRAVLTATRAYEYSFDGEIVTDQAMSGSVFTTGLVQGLRTGEADANADGLVSVEEAYAYAFSYVLENGEGQTPQRWLFGSEGSIWLAANPAGAAVVPTPVPDSIIVALQNPYVEVRLAAVNTLGQWLTSGEAGLAASAQQELRRIAASDDLPRVVLTASELLRPTATQRPLHVLVGDHDSWVRSVAFSPLDGVLLASGGDDAEIRLWNPATMSRQSLGPHTDWILDLAFSPSGDRLVSATVDGMIFVWNPETSHLVERISAHPAAVNALVFSPDGNRLASASADMTIRVAGRGHVMTLRGHRDAVHAVAFNHDGELLASGGGDAEIRLWDIATTRTVAVLSAHRAAIWSLAFNPDEHTLASAGEDAEIRIWDLAGGSVSKVLVGHRGPIYRIVFSPDGRLLASAGEDGLIRLWDPYTGQLIHALRGHTGWVRGLAFSSDGALLASTGKDKSVRVWGTASSEFTVAEERRVTAHGGDTSMGHSANVHSRYAALRFSAGAQIEMAQIQETVARSEDPEGRVSFDRLVEALWEAAPAGYVSESTLRAVLSGLCPGLWPIC
jgi:WD40 repeat protein